MCITSEFWSGVDEDTWYVLTPDRDLYPECWSGRSDEGPISFKLKDVDFRYFSRVSQPVYRFATYPTDDEFKSHISTALRELGLEGVNPLPWTPSSILDMRGQEANTRTYLEGILVRRRIVRRDLGRLDVPDPTQDPNACGISSLQTAPDGSLWVSMHDTEDHELGSEVGVPSRQAVRLDEANGVVKGPKGWTLVKLVKIGDLPDMVGSMDAMVRSRQVKRDGTSESAAKAADGEVVEVEADGAEDARTLAVEYDDQGERFRSWRDATRECREYSYCSRMVERPSNGCLFGPATKAYMTTIELCMKCELSWKPLSTLGPTISSIWVPWHVWRPWAGVCNPL